MRDQPGPDSAGRYGPVSSTLDPTPPLPLKSSCPCSKDAAKDRQQAATIARARTQTAASPLWLA